MAISRTKESAAVSVVPWGVEADHPRNCDLLLQCIPGARLRSVIKGTRPLIDAKTGDVRVPMDQSRGLASFPETPGMQLHVNPGAGTYVILDPLHGNEQLCERIVKFLRETRGASVGARINGVPPLEGTLDEHRMKTLCREMYNLVNANEAKIVKGVLPTLEDIEELPGNFLLNPGSRVGNTQPVYEKDFPGWVEMLSRSGG